MNTQQINIAKEKIRLLIEKMEPLEIKSLEHYAEFLLSKSNELRFLELLKDAKVSDEELTESEKAALKISRAEVERGEFTELEDFAKEHNTR